MIASIFKQPIARFLIYLAAFYAGWLLLYNLWLHPDERLDLFVVDITIAVSKWILESLGYIVFTGVERVIGVDGTGGLWIGDGCNAIALFSLFTGFIVAYPGKWKRKIIFIISGILLIELMNILRVVCLAILDTHSRAWTEFNHSYTFTIIMYAFIFWLWILWTNKFSGGSLMKDRQKA